MHSKEPVPNVQKNAQQRTGSQMCKRKERKNMYKLAAIDLDGTMLNQYGIVTQKAKEAIEKAKQRGIEIIIASGRPIDSIKSIAQEIKSEKYFISGNGAIIYDIANDEIIYENTLKKQKVLDIIKICEENSIYYNIYTEK